jgi:hypothetical protein
MLIVISVPLSNPGARKKYTPYLWTVCSKGAKLSVVGPSLDNRVAPSQSMKMSHKGVSGRLLLILWFHYLTSYYGKVNMKYRFEMFYTRGKTASDKERAQKKSFRNRKRISSRRLVKLSG